MNLGPQQKVEPWAIEKELSDLWRSNEGPGRGVMRAALWNVVAHTASDSDRNRAGEILAATSVDVPQRSIVISSAAAEESSLSSWVSANCHLLGDGKQVCSEQITIAAGGGRVGDVPSLVNALLIPDMPVAAWWVGDLPDDRDEYVRSLLEPADRFIVDSRAFDNIEDLNLFARIASRTDSMPGDLAWMRVAEWRRAVAAIFDPVEMRRRLSAIRTVRIIHAGDSNSFGQAVESIYMGAWLAAQASLDDTAVEWDIRQEESSAEPGSLRRVEVSFEGGASAAVEFDSSTSMLRSEVNGVDSAMPAVMRAPVQKTEQLIVRQLSHREDHRLLQRALPVACRLGAAIRR